MKLKKLITKDGSYTFYNPEIDDHYHSIFGAITESEHIFINSAYNKIDKENISVLEVGFGTGLNAILSLKEANKQNKNTLYHGVELYPISYENILRLNYIETTGISEKNLELIHASEWGKEIIISEHFTLLKTKADISIYSPDFKYDIIYFDAFGPDKQAEIWTNEMFTRMYNLLNPGGILSSFSVKGNVKRALKQAGFHIEILPGPPGKRHILRATKK